jgi:hypothetical protein
MTLGEIRHSTLAVEGALLVSKWIASQLLLDVDEMAEFLKHLGEFQFYRVDRVVNQEEGVMSTTSFLHAYEQYIQHLKSGEMPPEILFKNYFQSALSVSSTSFYQMPLQNERSIIKLHKPVVMLQHHRMHYSTVDGKFRPMVFTQDGFTWGVQLSYPQLYQHPQTMAVEKIIESDFFINTKLFNLIKKWIRYNTLPTPFTIDGKRSISPVRIGRKCFAWINKHPQLLELGITVQPYQPG